MGRTKEIKGGAVSPEGGYQHEALTLALSIIVERIRTLAAEEREEVYTLVKELEHADTAEEVDSLVLAMREILDQASMTWERMNLAEEVRPGPGLAKWIDFVSRRIRTLRKEAGMTQESLASKSGLPQSHISRLESGKHSPSQATLRRIASALRVPLSALDPSAEAATAHNGK